MRLCHTDVSYPYRSTATSPSYPANTLSGKHTNRPKNHPKYPNPHKPPPSQKSDLVPCSDCAGLVLAVGASVKNFTPGDRVCANFCTDHVFGDITLDIRNTGLGGLVDGVLTEVRVFKAYVSGCDCLE
jgi:NADPH:quinone reductase-like Zn-dependent oxidoreductase